MRDAFEKEKADFGDMVKNSFIKLLMAAALLLPAVCAYAQTSTTGTYGSFSPYSIYGVGEISKGGTAHSRSLGGVGIASRNRRFINVSNPAAVAVRDTLAFMADFGLYEDNKIYAQGSKRGAENTFNVNNIVMSFPIWRSSAFLVGLSPFSDVGYSFSSKEQSDELLGHVGNITYDSYGNGSLYQLYASAGATFWKRLSVGAEFIYYFGKLDRNSNETFENSTYRSITYGTNLNLHGFTGKFGVQYDQKLSPTMSMTKRSMRPLRPSTRNIPWATARKRAVNCSFCPWRSGITPLSPTATATPLSPTMARISSPMSFWTTSGMTSGTTAFPTIWKRVTPCFSPPGRAILWTWTATL